MYTMSSGEANAQTQGRALRAEAHKQLETPEERYDEWCAAMAAAFVDPATSEALLGRRYDTERVRKLADIFPATSGATFARWVAIYSPISREAELREPLLAEDPDRATILPIRDAEMWEFRKTIERLHWVAQEVDLSRDAADRGKVTPEEFALLEKVLGWFGPADEAVLAGLDAVAARHLQTKEARFYLRAQEDQECVHSEAYSLQIQEIIPPGERERVFRAARESPLVARAADWIRAWVAYEHPAADFFAAMAFVEGVLFSGFFAAIQHFKEKNVFPGVTQLNEFIVRDEGVHTRFWCFLLAKRLRARPSRAVVEAIARETVTLSDAFFADALPAPVAGLNADLLGAYVRHVADNVLVLAGYEPLFRAENPFPFMDKLALNQVGKSNFFEARPTQYQNIGTAGATRFAIDETPFADE